MDNEKAGFALRLKAALQDAGIEASGTRIEQLFNQRYAGAPVTTQAVASWLRGQHMPTPDKIRVLAEIVGVDPSVLAFGTQTGRRIGEPTTEWKVPAADRAAIDAFLALPAAQRKLVRELLVHLSGAGTSGP